MVANDFRTLSTHTRHIEWVFFNGAAAEKNFAELVPSLNRADSVLPAAFDQFRSNHALPGETGRL